MIKDIKTAFQILKYGLNVKTSIIFAIIFMVLGFLLDMVGNNTAVNAFYMPLVSIYIGQIAHSVVQSTMVQSSPNKKKMQTKIPALAMGCVLITYNTLSIIWRMVLLQINPWRAEDFIYGILAGGIMTIIIMVYFSFAMKMYYPATICFFILFYSLCFGTAFGRGIRLAGIESVGINISLFGAIVFSYFCILLGSFLNYCVNTWLYRRDYSSVNFKKTLERMK